jgi:hypothetical protein
LLGPRSDQKAAPQAQGQDTPDFAWGTVAFD